MDELSQHLVNVATKENIQLPADCATLIAAAAEGSVRDSLSLLDRAIAMHTDASGNISINPESVRDMLGLADKTQSFTLLKQLFSGQTEEALASAQKLHHQGADSAMLLSDLLDITHYLTRIVVAPQLANNLNYSPAEQGLAKEMAASLSVPALTRAWQILTKGAEEMRHAAHASATLEMILVRLGYAAALPTPSELVRQLQGSNSATGAASPAGEATRLGASAPSRSGEGISAHASHTAPRPHADMQPTASGAWANPTSPEGRGAPVAQLSQTTARSGASPVTAGSPATALKIEPIILAEVNSFLDVVKLFEERREALLASHLINDMRLVSFEQGRIEVKPISHMNPDVPARLNRRLSEWTGNKWNVIYNDRETGEPTIRETRAAAAKQLREYAIAHPRVQAVMEAFPGTTVIDFTPNKN